MYGLGVLYWSSGQIDRSEIETQHAVSLLSLFSLGGALSRRGGFGSSGGHRRRGNPNFLGLDGDLADLSHQKVRVGKNRHLGLDGKVVGLNRFGESAPAGALFKEFGFTGENVAKTVEEVL